MRTKRSEWLVAGALGTMALLPAGLLAQTASSSGAATANDAGRAAQPLGLLDAWTAAAEQDSTLRGARAAADAQRERLPQARARLRPNVNFTAAANRNDIHRTQTVAGLSSSTDEHYSSQNYSLNLRQPLYRPSLMLDLAQANQVLLEVDAGLESESRNLAVRLTGAYLEALLAQDQLALVKVQENTLRNQLAAVRAAFAAGSGVRTDIDEIQARLDLNQAQLLEATQQIESARRQLSVLVQRPVQALRGMPGEQFSLPALPSADVDDWVRQATQHSPELRALEARRDAARLEVEKTQASRKPTLDLVGQVVRSASENVLTPASRYQNHVLGLQFNLPIYSGGLIDSAVRQTTAELQRNEEALEGARRDLSVRVHREFRSFTEGERRIQALRQALRSAEQLVVSNKRSLQAGSRTLIDVLNAEQQQAQVRRDLAQTRYVTALSRLRLEMLVGDDPRESITRLSAVFNGD
jgi:protease secretion system outer membrane protein